MMSRSDPCAPGLIGSAAGLSVAHSQMTGEEAARLVARHWGLSGRAVRLATEKDDTFVLSTDRAHRYVLKVANPAEDRLEVDFEIQLMTHVARSGTLVPVPRLYPDRDGQLLIALQDDAGQSRHARLMSFVSGTPLDSTCSSPAEREAVGRTLGHLRHITRDFAHPVQDRVLAWDVRHLPRLRPLLDAVTDTAQRDLLEAGLDRFGAISGVVPALRRQVLHNDFSKSNIIVEHDAANFVRGIIDFGDAVHTAIAIDVSTALLNQLPRQIPNDPDVDVFAYGRDLLRGYLTVADLTDTELTAIPYLVMGRVIARALITLHRAGLMPSNAAYILRNTAPGWAQLRWFCHHTDDHLAALFLDGTVRARQSPPTTTRSHHRNGVPMIVASHSQRGKMVNAFNPDADLDLPPRTRELIERRAKLLGPAYRLFYRNPVHIVRGRGTRLWDDAGNEYLDAYNNVVSVGHANPQVVEAVYGQMQNLCTHTRYLHDGILDYAEQLRATVDGPLADGHLMLTCTGSEANDLALRIAKHRTGHRGVIVTSEAYHGNSDLTASFSPSLGEGSPLGAWVRRVPTPDSYRLDPAGLTQRLVTCVRDQIADLQRHGEGLAAFIVDSLFSSDGIFSEPTELLGPVAEAVHDAGGLFIADEVQCGFARTGEALWGHQRHGVRPDIMTLGKPMGNGFPVAGIMVTRDAVELFGHDQRYFNTFGGNTVAVAAAQATFDVIRDQDLLGNTARVGHEIREGLRDLSARHPGIGDVRGAGLYIGAEIVSDRDAKTPDPSAATAIVNGLRERRVLISATGFHANVLKIRPPLVFSSADADRLLTALDQTISSLG